MYKIIASDMDGTLLNPEHRIGSYTREILHTLYERGYIFAFATGRHHIEVAQYRELLGIPAYMISSNGARVYDTQDNQIFSQSLEPDVVKELVSMAAHDKSVDIQMYSTTQWLINRDKPEILQFHTSSDFSYVVYDEKNPPTDDIAKVYLTSYERDHEHLCEWEDKFNQALGNKVHIAFSSPWCLEIMAHGVSKGDSLSVVAKENGLSLNDCIAFGDGMNDLEMLKGVKKGLIMQTAHDRLKAAAPELEIIGSCLDEGVAHYLEDFLLK